MAQTYTQLWKQATQAEEQDLPQTQQEALVKISAKARAEHNYGQLLKAELKSAQVSASVSPDSMLTAVARLKQQQEAATDDVLKAVYSAVLGYVFEHNSNIETLVDSEELLEGRTPQEWATHYYDLAMAQPEKLAQAKAADYVPLLVTGADSRYFLDDMLSVIGFETGHFRQLHDYYRQKGDMRRAAVLTGVEMLRQERPEEYGVRVNKSDYLQRVDSLLQQYGDLTEAGEAAIEYYQYMDEHTDATVEQKVQYINMALGRWGAWQRMNELRNALRTLQALQYTASIEAKVAVPDCPQKVQLYDLRGISQLTLRVYSVKTTGDVTFNPNNNESYKKLKPLLTPLPHLTMTRTFVGKRPYEVFEDSVELPGLPVGIYLLEMESSPTVAVSRQLYYVSALRVLHQDLPEGQRRYVVVDAASGHPVKGASVKLYSNNGGSPKPLATLTTDAHGECLYTASSWKTTPHYIYAYTASDHACPQLSAYGFYLSEQQAVAERGSVFTDRAIYRPGQTVMASVLVYRTNNGFEHQVVKGRKMTMRLRDANYKLVEEKMVELNEYGTASAAFTLPSTGLAGSYTVQADNYRQSFRVEEYKRPTFQVEFPEVNSRYEEGDTVVVTATAKNYAGVPVQGAKVSYRVVRRMPYWWFSYSRYWQMGTIGASASEEELLTAETVTAADGTFAVEIPMVLPPSPQPMFYNFVVTADVTDQGGETHQGVLTLPLGNRKTAFTAEVPEQMLAERPQPVTFHLRNASGADIDAPVSYRLDGGKWADARTNTPVALGQLKSGRHTLEAVCEGDTLQSSLVVFSLDDKRPATETDDWFYVSADQFPNDGTPVTVQVGSSDKDVHIYYTLLAGSRVLEKGVVSRSNGLINRKLFYDSAYGDGLFLAYAWVRNGVCHNHTATLRRPVPDDRLRLSWTTFRDRLTPGQQEEWTLHIEKPDGTPAEAELMAVLYDKSLDQLASHQWSFSPYTHFILPHAPWQYAYDQLGGLRFSGYKHQGYLNVAGLALTQFDHSVYPQQLRYRAYGRAASRMRKNGAVLFDAVETMDELAAPMMVATVGAVQKEAMEEAADAEVAYAKEVVTDADDDRQAEAVQVRENLQETAFFYPQLTTDSTGLVALRFTLPESLTTWRFMGLAHTRDVMYGQLEAEAVAKKDVMIQPNVPRFLREGDKATLTARLFNTSDHAIKGAARLVLVDPTTEKTVFEARQSVALQADSTTSVSFTFSPTDKTPSLLIAKYTVSGQGFSDGEQHYVPVLSNREQVTRTVPFTQTKPGTTTIDLQALVPQNVTHVRLTAEYTNNPAWLLVQALPAIGHPHDDCAFCQSTAYYANAIGQHIIKQNPQAKAVFEQWKRETGQETSLFSQLAKNETLKDLVLSETPWVIDADDEAEQRQRLADFFDQNLMQHRLTTAVDKLRQLQNGEGAWCWWQGMHSSLIVTTGVSELLVRLGQMTGTAGLGTVEADLQLDDNEKAVRQMLDRAFGYMDREMLDLVRRMKAEEKKGHKQTFPTFTALQYLYLSKLDGRTPSKSVAEAQDYLKQLLAKERKGQTIYEKALSAIVLDSKTYAQSLKEYTVYKEDMGRYYDTQRAAYSWRDYRLPTQVAAIEALKRLTPDDTVTISQMQRWLLQQKHTQAWDTPINSADAVYAFLDGNQQALRAQEPTRLAVDGHELETQEATAGFGYVKAAITPTTAKAFTAEKTSEGTSWGAVYAQFVQRTSEVTDQKSGISVRRELLVKEGSSLSPLTSHASPLAVGTRLVVRITLQADRDYDFVEVVDRRAACLEPVQQLSGYRGGAYVSPRDQATHFFFDMLPKGKHVIETEYYVDRAGQYETGTCTAACAYAPEFRGTTHSQTITAE